jgi:thioredoxin reductase (NADPH)
MVQDKLYDLVILGGGPAGVTAAIYGARAGLSAILLEKMIVGGEIVSTDRLDNYPGFPDGITGAAFGLLLESQLQRFHVAVRAAAVEQVSFKGEAKKVFTPEEEITGRAVVIATGTVPRLLNVDGELSLRGRGVSYCATCDAAFFRGKDVAVVGGGDAALEETIFLSRLAGKIYLIHRREAFRGVKALQEKVYSLPNVEILWNTTVEKIEGERRVEGVRLARDGKELFLALQGIFIYVGRQPNTGFLRDEVPLDEQGFIITNEKMETALPRVYAAGDVRRKELRQVITAAADGAVAATMATRSLAVGS